MESSELLTKETTCCGSPVTLHLTVDGLHWFSSERDIQIYEWRKAKSELKLHPRTNLPMSRFSL